jgi:hypothetical protein
VDERLVTEELPFVGLHVVMSRSVFAVGCKLGTVGLRISNCLNLFSVGLFVVVADAFRFLLISIVPIKKR